MGGSNTKRSMCKPVAYWARHRLIVRGVSTSMVQLCSSRWGHVMSRMRAQAFIFDPWEAAPWSSITSNLTLHYIKFSWCTTISKKEEDCSSNMDPLMNNSNVKGIKMNKRLVGILSFPRVKVPSCWLLGKILCIEDSGGSSALVYTVNWCSSCDYKIMVSDTTSWFWFKVKNNSLLTFSPLCLRREKKKSLWFGTAAKTLWEQEV